MKAEGVVVYPAGEDRVVLRMAIDWGRDVEPVEVSPDNTRHKFVVETDEEVVEGKPCLYRGNKLHWAIGLNHWIPIGTGVHYENHPHFFDEDGGRVSKLYEVESRLGEPRRLRVYLPAGYDENTLARYQVIYMQDGANLFLPDEAFLNQEWGVDETMDLLDRMNLIQRSIVVGIHAQNRMKEYTDVGYEDYGRSLKDEIKPWIDGKLRTRPGPEDTVVIGSSLGGVVSFFLGWQWPEVFGNIACLSSTFGYRDDLLARVRHEPLAARRHLKVYLDSGWPEDNYEATLTMAVMLASRGFAPGGDVLHWAFPLGKHREQDWGDRLHLPLQFFCGQPRWIAKLLRDCRNA